MFFKLYIFYKLWEVHVEQSHFSSNFIIINAIFPLAQSALSQFHCLLLFIISFLGPSVSIFGVSFTRYLWLLCRYHQLFSFCFDFMLLSIVVIYLFVTRAWTMFDGRCNICPYFILRCSDFVGEILFRFQFNGFF